MSAGRGCVARALHDLVLHTSVEDEPFHHHHDLQVVNDDDVNDAPLSGCIAAVRIFGRVAGGAVMLAAALAMRCFSLLLIASALPLRVVGMMLLGLVVGADGTTSLIAALDLTGATGGNTITGSSSNVINATLHGGASRTATGVVLDGSDGYLDVNLDAVTIGGPMTIVMVAKWNAFNSDSRLFDCGDGANDNNIKVHNVGTTGQLEWSVLRGSSNKYVYSPGTSDLKVDARYHIAVTVNGTSMISYINGVQKGVKTNGHEPIVKTRSKCFIGKANWVGSSYITDECWSHRYSNGYCSDCYGWGCSYAVTRSLSGCKYHCVRHQICYIASRCALC